MLRAAAELFDRLGYEKVRMEDVAARSHVSKNTLYRRFPHKTALLTGLVQVFAAEFALHLGALTERRHDADVQ
ncbi:MAG: helix-turn-helix transcriptional regulator, partial [Deltaproteobacteria bacterium]|nr:helix-turn-helix transcriptional regulator [Deltaproteobacteria bacterium]